MGSNPTLSARKRNGPLVGPFRFLAECGMGIRTLFDRSSRAAPRRGRRTPVARCRVDGSSMVPSRRAPAAMGRGRQRQSDGTESDEGDEASELVQGGFSLVGGSWCRANVRRPATQAPRAARRCRLSGGAFRTEIVGVGMRTPDLVFARSRVPLQYSTRCRPRRNLRPPRTVGSP